MFNLKTGSLILFVILICILTVSVFIPASNLRENWDVSASITRGSFTEVSEPPGGPSNPPPLEVIYQFGYRVVTLDELRFYEEEFGVEIPYLKELIDGSKLREVIVEAPQGKLVRVIFEYTLQEPGNFFNTTIYKGAKIPIPPKNPKLAHKRLIKLSSLTVSVWFRSRTCKYWDMLVDTALRNPNVTVFDINNLKALMYIHHHVYGDIYEVKTCLSSNKSITVTAWGKDPITILKTMQQFIEIYLTSKES